MQQQVTFQIVALQSSNFVELTYDFRFPPTIQQTSRANWTAQDTTVGTRPLFYGNREPLQIVVPELWLDKTETDESVRADIVALFVLQNERDGEGKPPALVVSWGSNRELVVLEEVFVEEVFFRYDGEPLRARVSLTFLELQDTMTMTGSREIEDGDETAAAAGRPRRVTE